MVKSAIMKFFIDSADVNAIRDLQKCFPVSGVTTNPSILAKEGKNFKKVLCELGALLGGKFSIHVQAVSDSAEEILKQAKEYKKTMGDNFYVKIPITEQGLRAVALCKGAGIKSTVTAVFTPTQALLAATSGADYVAPYVDRLDAMNCNGPEIVKQIVDILKIHNMKTEVLAASFKNLRQICEVALAGAHAITVSPEMFKKLLFHPYTEKSIKDFEADWKSISG